MQAEEGSEEDGLYFLPPAGQDSSAPINGSLLTSLTECTLTQ